MIAFDYILFSAAALYGLYILYCASMNIKRVHDAGKLTAIGKALGIPALLIAVALDALCNIFVMSVLLAELPREWLVTTRLQRHHKESTGWRLAVVKFFEPVLDPLDPDGDHI